MIAILAPYGRNEVTSAAIRLCEFAASLGLRADYVACGLRENRVHPFWDSLVKSPGNGGIYKAAGKAECVVHFQCHQAWYEDSSLVTKREVKHILVPNWHGLAGRDSSLIPRYDQIICPTKLCKKTVLADAFDNEKDVGRDRLTWVNWDSGLPAVRREGTVSDGRLKACVVCDSASVDFCGPMLLHAVDQLLATHARLDVSVLSLKSWCRRDKAQLAKLSKAWGKRLTHRRATGHDMVAEYHAHDWALFPGVRADFGSGPAQAMSCGCAVIANDVEPFASIVGNAGILVPCEIRHGAARAPIAVPSLGNWLEAGREAFSGPKTLLNIQTRDWGLKKRGEVFGAVWSKAWGL